MTGEVTYEWLTELLVGEMRKAYPKFDRVQELKAESQGSKPKNQESKIKGYGAYDKILENKKVAHLRGLLKNIVCRPDCPLAYVAPKEGLYVFNGRFYENTGDGAVFMGELVERVLERLNVGEIYRMYGSEKIARSIVKSLESSEIYLYKPNRRYVAFTNGIFDLEKGKLTKFDRTKVPAIILDFAYADPKAHYGACAEKYGVMDNPCKRWDRFIDEVLPNKQFQKAFHCFCGLLLADRDTIKVEYMACIHGPGSNGKSVLAECVAKVFGKEYYSTFTPHQLFKQGSNSMFCVADLAGKILNLTGDLDKADFSSGEFKSFVSGEDVRAREPYGRKFRFIKPPLMMCCTNSLPRTSDDSQGYHRRILPIASTTKMYSGAERDTGLTHKLTQPDARCYIFSWIYSGYKQVRSNNWDIPIGEEVQRAIEYAMNNSNSMRLWWNSGECKWRKPKADEEGEWVLLNKVIYAAYVDWCHDCNEKPFDITDFGRMLHSLGYSKKAGNVRRMGNGTEYRVKIKEIEEIKD